MFNKKNIKLFIILLILILGAWFYMVPYQQMMQAKNPNFLTKIKIDQIAKIEAIKNLPTKDEVTETHVLIKEGNEWRVAPDNWPTETIIIDALIEKLTNLTKLDFEIASVNAEKKPSFQTDQQGLKVILYNNKEEELINFIIGKVSNDYQSTFIGQEGDDNTYRVKETFVRAFDVDSWQDKTIFDYEIEKVDTVVFKYSTYEFEITNQPDSRGEIYWHTSKPYVVRLKKEKAEEARDKLAKLEANEVPDQNIPGTGLEKNNLVITIKGEGVEESLIIGDIYSKKAYFVKKVSTGQIFLISEDDYKILNKQIRSLQ